MKRNKSLFRNKDSWLDIPVTMTPVSLSLPKNLTRDQWAAIGPKIVRLHRFTTWAIADWLNYGEIRYGETYSQAADATGLQPDYLAVVKYVGASIDPSRRREGLSFSHHRLVVPLTAEEQERFLSDAEKNNWSCEQMREAVREFKGQSPGEVRISEPDGLEFGLTESLLNPAEPSREWWTGFTGDFRWYTPEIYVESARRVMGGIDLDPASADEAQKTVGAKEYFTEETDGLKQEWKGRIFLNPPYTGIGDFIKKLCDEFFAGNVEAAILLTNNCTDTKRWHQALKASQAICFTQGRIKFYKPDGRDSQPVQGQCFFYFGTDLPAFATEFSRYGLTIGVYPWLCNDPGKSTGV